METTPIRARRPGARAMLNRWVGQAPANANTPGFQHTMKNRPIYELPLACPDFTADLKVLSAQRTIVYGSTESMGITPD
jgi:hypothetical protein